MPRRLPQMLAAALLGVGLPLAAQTLPSQLPSGAEPGREAPRPVLPLSSQSLPKIEVPRSAAAVVPPGAREARFKLEELLLEGASAYPAERIRSLYAGLLGREVSVAEVFEVANAIELLYRNDGFVTSRVIVPQQTVENGRFRILVVEGHVSQVLFRGQAGPAQAAIEKLLGGLTQLRPVSVAEIERRLLLANDLPGYNVRGTLEPSPTEPGGSVLVVSSEHRTMDASATLDNRASPYLGSSQLTAQAAWFGLGSRADRVSVNVRSSLPLGRITSVGAVYDALMTSQGGTLGAALSHTRSKPGRELKVLEVDSQVNSLIGTWAQPLIRSREENLRAVGQLEFRDVSTDMVGAAFTRDRLRIVRVGLSYDRSDRFDGITTVRGTWHQGLPGLGASDNRSALASRPNGRSNFAKLTLDVSRVQQLGVRTHLMASMTSQFSPKPLLASEELSLGGASYGRAFDDGEIAGDNGYAVMVELRHHPEFLPRQAQLYAYIDAGRVWAAEGGATPQRNKLTSWGGGVRANLHRSVFATLELAKPINTEVRTRQSKGARAFVTLTAQF